MKKARSDSGTVHLFSNASVLRSTGNSRGRPAMSLCGSVDHSGPFTKYSGDDIEGMCENCKRATEDDDDE